MAPGNPLSFASRDYWNQRFADESTPFDWLHPSSILTKPLLEAIQDCKIRGIEKPRILHIGCGTSLLSLLLCAYVDDPSQIWNVDFSEEAVRLGKLWEDEVVRLGLDVKDEAAVGAVLKDLRSETPSVTIDRHELHDSNADAGKSRGRTHWHAVDLLNMDSIATQLPGASFDIIIEKSCADAIACGEDVEYQQSTPEIPVLCFHRQQHASTNDELANHIDSPQSPDFPPVHLPDQSKASLAIHPVSLLALHLAYLATPAAHWLLLSFSEDRLAWIGTPFRQPPSVPVCLRDPAELWERVGKEQVATAESEGLGEGVVVHRPKVWHWVFALRRR